MIPRPDPIDPPPSSPATCTTSEGSRHHGRPTDQPQSQSQSQSRSSSPERPPVSPITPFATLAQLAPPRPAVERAVPPQPATFIPRPDSVPISESENPDAIALRSAISLLQLQREKSKRDIRTLGELKTLAVADPQGFVRELQGQRQAREKVPRDALTNTLSDIAEAAHTQLSSIQDAETSPRERKDSANPGEAPSAKANSSTEFPSIPQPQDVFRCPPINWAKYHVIGESLDKLHEEQRQRPTPGEATRDQRQPRHVIAAPYSPFADRVAEVQPMQTRKGSKKATP